MADYDQQEVINGLLQPPKNPALPPESVQNVIRALAQGLGNIVSMPKRAMEQGVTTEQAVPWAADTAIAMTGIRAPFAKAGELGVAGGKPRTFWRGENLGDPRRIRTGNEAFDSHLFASSNKDSAMMYGKDLKQLEAIPDAKILYEGTQEFVKTAGRWRKGESLLDYSARASEAAKKAGYDAVHFKRQGDVGTAIFNPAKFVIK